MSLAPIRVTVTATIVAKADTTCKLTACSGLQVSRHVPADHTILDGGVFRRSHHDARCKTRFIAGSDADVAGLGNGDGLCRL